MSLQPEASDIWGALQERLRGRLSSVAYHTWVAHAEPISYEDGVLRLGVANSYAQEKLLAIDTLQEAARDVLGAGARVEVAIPGEVDTADPQPNLSPQEPTDEAIHVRPVYLSDYDEIVHPERVITIPRYYLRWLPYLGVDLAWIPIGFRQIAFFRGLAFEQGDVFKCSYRELALWSGMSERNLYRKINDPRLGWFIERTAAEPKWKIGYADKPHREALEWRVVFSMPLTPIDQAALGSFLQSRLAEDLTPSQALQAAYQIPLGELLPPIGGDQIPEMAGPAKGVEQVVAEALGAAALDTVNKQILNALSMKVAGYGESLEVTHYFVRNQLPSHGLGSGRGWLVQWLRCLLHEQGYPSSVLVAGSYRWIAESLGVDQGTVRRWMAEAKDPGAHLSLFLEPQGTIKHADGATDLIVAVRRDEPMPGGEMEGVQSVRISQRQDAQSVSIRARSGAHSVMIRDPRDAHSVRHETPDDAQNGSYSPGHPAHSVSNVPKGKLQSDRISGVGMTRELSGLKGGGGNHGELSESREVNPSSTFNPVRLITDDFSVRYGDTSEWNIDDLLGNASVHPVRARDLRGSSAIAWVSWLLYWASPAGAKVADPIGHTISRLKEAPSVAMGGAFERLAALGPKGLEKLLVPRIVNPWGWRHPSNVDWDDVMRDAPKERLRRLVDLLGFDVSAWEEAEGADDDEG